MSESIFQLKLEKQLLRDAQQGNQLACEKIYRLYASPAYSLARRLLVCPEHAKEATQDAFVSAFRRLSSFEGEVPFWAWLRKIVSNASIDMIRRRKPEVSLDAISGDAHHPSVTDSAANQLLLEQLLLSLCDDDRVIVWLHDVEGFKHHEIASQLGRSVSYSKTRLSRARAKLLCFAEKETPAPISAARKFSPLMKAT
ncbi:MAG: sigma-70 family RNA polymerase sigma factor [Xanthomonadales bacterium]|nr:sigma-70 family RNA polymerase sigma factor [Xanthomonadales bacterium]